MVRQTAGVVIFEILGGVLFLAVMAAAFMAWRLSQGPLELGAMKSDVEQALSVARGGRDVDIARLQLQWSPERRRVDVTAEDVTFYNQTGDLAGTAQAAHIELDASALLLGEVDILAISLEGGFIEVRQVSSDVWSVAGEPLPPIPTASFPQSADEWLAALNRALDAIMVGSEAAIHTVTVNEVALENFTIDVVLQSGTRVARLEATSGTLARIGDDVALSLDAQGAGAGLPEHISLALSSQDNISAMSLQAGVTGWTLSELAAILGAQNDRATGLPAQLTLSLLAQRDGGLQSVDVTAQAGAGALRLDSSSVPVSRIDGTLNYDTGSDLLSFDFPTIDAGFARGTLSGQVADAVYGSGQRHLALRAPDLRIDATPMFETPWVLRAVEAELGIEADGRRVSIDRASIRTQGATISAMGDFTRVEDSGEGQLPFSLNLTAEMTGETGTDTVLAFWPVNLGDGARRYVRSNVEAGNLTGAIAQVSISPNSMSRGYLDDDALDVSFSVSDARVRFLSDMPPVENAAGTGRLTGNAFSVQLVRGSWSNWDLSTGGVDFPQLNPKGGDMIVTAAGAGVVDDVIGPVFRSRLNLQEASGFDPDRLSGNGQATFRMVRPALDNVPMEDIAFEVTGQIREGGLRDVAGGYSLSEATARVDITNDRLAVTGFGELGPSTVNFEWRDAFNDGGAPSQLTARSVVSPDVLNQFGLLGRPYITGEVPVEVIAGILGDDVVNSHAQLDLTDARIDLTEIGWLKPPGDPASAEIVYRLEGAQRFAAATLTSETARFEGDLRLGETGRLIEADVARAYLAGRVDVSGQVQRGPDGSLSLSLQGPLLDVSSAMPSASNMSGGSEFNSALTLDAEVSRLVVSDSLTLNDARLAAISTADGLQSLTASGEIGSVGQLDASYRQSDDGAAVIAVSADNAGALIETFFNTDFLIGGSLTLNGILRSDGEANEYDILIERARLRDAPFLTQILSLASLRGLADTLGGEGVLFSRIDLPLRALGGRYVVNGGRASGPALGLTVNGWVEPEDGGIAIDGVLVPSFGVNSALGGVPIIGDLFVGRDGEGVFSLTYAVRGELARAQVSVNPLSAITPGVLRRIFENPSETDLPLPEEAPVEEAAPAE